MSANGSTGFGVATTGSTLAITFASSWIGAASAVVSTSVISSISEIEASCFDPISSSIASSSLSTYTYAFAFTSTFAYTSSYTFTEAFTFTSTSTYTSTYTYTSTSTFDFYL